jgi:hypothetical protein
VGLGFLFAPVVVCALLSVPGFWDDIIFLNMTALQALGHEAFVFVFYVMGCYFITLIFALPLYSLGWSYFRVNLLTCLIAGAAIGGVPSWFFFALQYLGFWPKWDDEKLGGVPLIVDHKFTRVGLEHYFMGGVLTATFGAAIALVFWWIAIRNNPPAQSKRLVEHRFSQAGMV